MSSPPTATATGTGPGLQPDGPAPAGLDQLAPVVAALRAASGVRVAAMAAAAQAEVAAVRAEADARARAVTERARRDGVAGARSAAAGRMAEALRDGRNTVLAARRTAYEDLRRSVVAELGSRLDTPEGIRLRSWLIRLVSERSGIPAVEQQGPVRAAGIWRVVAAGGSTVATLDLEAVVDQALQWNAAEVEELWR